MLSQVPKITLSSGCSLLLQSVGMATVALLWSCYLCCRDRFCDFPVVGDIVIQRFFFVFLFLCISWIITLLYSAALCGPTKISSPGHPFPPFTIPMPDLLGLSKAYTSPSAFTLDHIPSSYLSPNPSFPYL